MSGKGTSKRPATFLKQRGQIFYYRRRVPDDLREHIGAPYLAQTLRTRQKRDAEAKAREIATEHDALFKRLRSATLADRYRDLSETLDIAGDSMPLPDRELRTYRKTKEAAAKVRRAMLRAAEENFAKLRGIDRVRLAPLVNAAGGVEAYFLAAEAEANLFRRTSVDVLIDRAMLPVRDGNDLDAADAVEAKEGLLKIKGRGIARKREALVKLGLAADEDDVDDPENPRIKSALATFLADRKQGPSASRRHRVAVDRFVAVHGNLPLQSVTKQLVREFIAASENLPDARKLPNSARTVPDDPGPHIPRVAATTVGGHLTSLKALLNFAVEREWVAVNVAAKLKPPKDTRPKDSKRRAFTRDERKAVLAKAIEEGGINGDMPWLIRLGAYTGARMEELLQLRRTEVRNVEGVTCIVVTDVDASGKAKGGVKTESSLRSIPLHAVIRDDFLTWVGSNTHERVFTTFKADKRTGTFSNKASGQFARLMDRVGLTDPRLVFHSFRHGIKREMIAAKVDPDVRRAVMGHADKDAHDGYGGVSLETIADELKKMPDLF